MIYYIQIWKDDPKQKYYATTLTLMDLLIQQGLLQLKGTCSNLQGRNFNLKEIRIIRGNMAGRILASAY